MKINRRNANLRAMTTILTLLTPRDMLLNNDKDSMNLYEYLAEALIKCLVPKGAHVGGRCDLSHASCLAHTFISAVIYGIKNSIISSLLLFLQATQKSRKHWA